MRLALLEAPGCSPVEAIDRAIDLALAGRDGALFNERIEAMEDSLEAMDARRNAEATKIESAVEAVSRSVKELNAILADALDAGDQ